MVDRPGLSKAEMEVARVLWQLGRATVREVHESLSAERDVEFATVQTYLRRMAEKGYIRSAMHGRVRVYSPRIRPGTVIREALGDLADRLFRGETLPMVRHLIEDGNLTEDELSQLRALIDRLEQEQRDDRS